MLDRVQSETAMKVAAPAGGEPRLLLVFNSFGFMLSHFQPVLEAAIEAGFEVHAAAPPEPEAERRLEALGLTLHRIRMDRHGIGPLTELRTVGEIWRLFRRLRPDVVHLATIKPVVYGGIAARLAGVPAVLSAITGLGYVFIGSTWQGRLLGRLLRPLYRRALRHPCQRVMFENAADRATVEGMGVDLARRSELTPGYGVDLELFAAAPEPEGPVTVLLAARLLIDKGVHEFVEAARMLRAEGAEARFVIAGHAPEGNPASVPETTLAAWRAEGAVELRGFCTDMPRLLAGSHVVALPSYREGFPRALVEAAASARPVVATDVPGCRDAVIDGETGFLVPARDPAALAGAIRTLLDEPERRRRMGRAARGLAERTFSDRRVAGRHRELYRSLAAAARGG